MGLYLNHVNTVLRKLRETPVSSLSTDETTEAYKAQEAVKRAVRRIWNAKQWSFKQRKTTFTTTSGVLEYNIPKTVGHIYGLLSSDSPYEIDLVNEDFFDEQIPNPTATGNPRFARLFELAGVSTQPSAASVITATSSETTDTTQTLVIRGLVSGEEDYETLTLNGTNDVSTTKLFSHIISVSKSAVTDGRVTLTSNAGVVTNLIMSPLETTIRRRKITFYPEPASTLTITVKYFAFTPKLINAYDSVQIPDDWNYVVDQWAYALALQYKGQDQLPEFTTQYNIAKMMLDEDMLVEEKISSDEPIILQRYDQTGENPWNEPPSGYFYTQSWP